MEAVEPFSRPKWLCGAGSVESVVIDKPAIVDRSPQPRETSYEMGDAQGMAVPRIQYEPRPLDSTRQIPAGGRSLVIALSINATSKC